MAITLYAATALRALALHRHAAWPVAFPVFVASTLLGIAVISETGGDLWQLSWWSYHVDMLIAFLVVTVGLVRAYEEVRVFRLTHYFALTAAVFLGISFFVAYEIGNSLLAAELQTTTGARVEPVLLGSVAVLLVSLFTAFLLIVRRGDRLLQERQHHLAQARQRLEAILNAQPDGVIVVSGDGAIERANPVAQRWLDGKEPDIPPAQLKALLMDLCAQTRPEEEVTYGNVTLRARAARFDDDGTVVIFHDISRLKEVDRMKTEFVSTVSHELRTPLANIKLYLSLLRKGRSENRSTYLDTLEQESDRLNALVEKVLDLSRIDGGAVEAAYDEMVDLNQLIETVAAQYQASLAAKRMQLHLSLAAARPRIRGDEDMLTQVIVNLLGNAIHYTQVGGRIEMQSAVNDERVIFTVRDNGPGIPAEDQENIFKRFYRGKTGRQSKAPGTGLGLAIVKEIVEHHKGDVGVESTVGLGTTFTVTLPRAGETSMPAEAAQTALT